ncbi:hypothetical protein Q2T40_17320 [Winogradskyella maritima]|uniref:Uncharacterized protein n=1 Tax=Winogradskyella maritima TaxID=1517766 RepID=A0ABV8AIS6_9FLAO|nr:hypothetical protein [Winogradskyella maritima]
MNRLIFILLLICLGCIIGGFVFDLEHSQKFIGFGVLGLFFVVFPLFIYHRWKDKDFKDYMLTQENIEKMKQNQKEKKY